MSIILSRSRGSPEAKTFGFGPSTRLFFEGEEISLIDFFRQALHALIDKPIVEDDARLHFVECMKTMKVEKGYGGEIFWNGKYKSLPNKTKRLKTVNEPLPSWANQEATNYGRLKDSRTFAFKISQSIFILSLLDMLCLTFYVLTNTNLQMNDPEDCRRAFVKSVSSMRVNRKGKLEPTILFAKVA